MSLPPVHQGNQPCLTGDKFDGRLEDESEEVRQVQLGRHGAADGKQELSLQNSYIH
ncbi:MAG: hypothetical protein R3C44_16305 [Chloroflexota bacterium]